MTMTVKKTSNTGTITKAGIHPSSHVRPGIETEGKPGTAKPSTPKPAQVAAAGATNATAASGKHMQDGKAKPTMSQIMYPKQLGLRGESE